MPDRTHEFGKYGARGVKGSDAVARQLDELAGFIATPITQRRGLKARLNYLTRTPHALQAAHAAGLTLTDRTLKAWQTGRRRPSKANLEKIETAYRTVRRHNVARYLLQRLNSRGGTRVEIHPLNQSQVDRRFQRVLEYRTLNIRQWDTIIRAWAAGDTSALDEAWIDSIVDLGSQWGQYEYVSAVGFAA
ncbi:transcriptional regulator [Streptomyces sp. TRM66268-LWL]|uniref:Transcriptional regulator n=1 Tax=Streptomyces polyasparticus TaxID=2767826 RepID=A0ABR7STQ5_9ACTN|nr:transcriptional regulator [Streptomyces polyasparticus]MBC9718849.1 transcriptional regulator [Streptomyces polyasparticus]